VGADREQVPAHIALDCMQAAELLELAGGHAEPVPLVDENPRASIRAAMGALGLLDQETFATPYVLEPVRKPYAAAVRAGAGAVAGGWCCRASRRPMMVIMAQ